MFHAFDNHSAPPPARRAQWMAQLARAPMPLLEAGLGERAGIAPRWLRAPETGLMMVQGRAGGSGERFNLGEITVTRCALRVEGGGEAGDTDAPVGVAYVLGRSHRQAQLAAVADALLQDPRHHDAIATSLLAPLAAHIARDAAGRAARARRSKVEFFTVARESGAGVDGDEEEAA